jgi:ribonuclease BN (tRNA processing enzyme)
MTTRTAYLGAALFSAGLFSAHAQRPDARGEGAPGGAPQHPPPERIIQDFDRNSDGKLSREEAPDRMASRWESIDADRDGFVTRTELEARDARVAGGGLREALGESAPAQKVPVAIPGMRVYVNSALKVAKRDGKSWATAFASLQEALATNAGEIWVAKGSYIPGLGSASTFQLRAGGALYGGFAGGETSLGQRDWARNKTVLQGRGASHVVTGADDAVLDGFTITGGSALESGRAGGPMGAPPGGVGGRPIHLTPQSVSGGTGAGCGAGLLNLRASPTVRNCVFEGNKAGKGGAVYNMTSAGFPPRTDAAAKAPVFIGCLFKSNFARGRGGGVSNDLGTSPTFLNCVFEGNTTDEKGGGMYNDFGSSPTLINCLFTGNSAKSAGGMGNDGGSSPILDHCTFTQNRAEDYGAPLYQGSGPASNPVLLDCVIADNVCEWEGPGIYNWHGNAPVIKDTTPGDDGYKAGRLAEEQLARRLVDLASYRRPPVREPEPAAVAKAPSSSRVVYADAAAGAAGDGRAWPTAYRSLTAALEDAGRDGAELRLAAGTYALGKDRSESFVLRPGVRLSGGFKGDRRDPSKYVTTLAGNGAYHVLVGAEGAALDGLVVTGGRADGDGYAGKGGGLVTYRDAPQGRPRSEAGTGFTMAVSRCVFSNNVARDGGAVYSYDSAKVTYSDCVFADNRAENGGAVLDRVGVKSVFDRCTFDRNAAAWRGGALYVDYGSRPVLTGCTFRGNSAGAHGGAVFSVSRASQLENSVVTLNVCVFEGNTAKGDGGGAAFCDSTVSVLQSCTFAGNRAGRKGHDVYADASSEEASRAGAPREPAAASAESSAESFRERGQAHAKTVQPSASFSAFILGSGGPPYDPERAGPCVAVQRGGRFVLVDMGNGAQARLHEAGIVAPLIDALMVTHHHRDHDEEFVPLLASALVRAAPPAVIGPEGTQRLADFTAEFYAEDIAYRIERMGRAKSAIRLPAVRELKGGESFDLAGMQVRAAAVPHSIRALAYRFEAGGQSIVISGDLTYSDEFIAFAQGADVLILDAGGAAVREGGADGGSGRTGAAPLAHPALDDVRAMAQKSGCKKLVLTHLVGGGIDEAATIRAVKLGYKGEVLLARDLLEVAPAKN